MLQQSDHSCAVIIIIVSTSQVIPHLERFVSSIPRTFSLLKNLKAAEMISAGR
jgi:hypothetical protein